MKNAINFKIIITQDEDRVFVASCPAIPGCHSQGDTYEEATKNIKEAISLCLKIAQDDVEYRNSIDFSASETPRFFGISDMQFPLPNFV